MSLKPERLRRLARAQGGLAKVLATTLLRAEHTSTALLTEQAQLDSMAVKAGGTQPELLPSLLRSLAATEQRAKLAQAEVEKAQRTLLEAKSREKSIARRARLLGNEESRKAAEEDALETALAMSAKASGKGRVVI